MHRLTDRTPLTIRRPEMVALIMSRHRLTLTYGFYTEAGDGGALVLVPAKDWVLNRWPVNTHSAMSHFALLGNPDFLAEGGTLRFGLRDDCFIQTMRSPATSMVCSRASMLSFIGVLVQLELKHRSWPRINILCSLFCVLFVPAIDVSWPNLYHFTTSIANKFETDLSSPRLV